MKRILLIICVLASLASAAQPPTTGAGQYTYIAQQYNWLAGYFKSLTLPSGAGAPVSPLRMWPGAGGIYLDSVGNKWYYRQNMTWKEWRSMPNVNLPFYISIGPDGDTLNLNPATNADDGYLTAADHASFDSAAKMFKDTINSYITPKNNRYVYAKQLLFSETGAISYFNTSWDANPYPVLNFSPISQNAFYGDRGGAARTLAGTLTGTKNTAIGSLSANALTTGENNAFLGKGAGGYVTSGSRNIYIGFDVAGAPTVNDSLSIGGWILGKSGILRFPSMIGLSASDSTDKPATTAWVKQQSFGSGSGDQTPELNVTPISTNFTITEPSDHRIKTYQVNGLGAAITVSPPASPTNGQIIIIYHMDNSGGSTTVNTNVGDVILTTYKTSVMLQWSDTFYNYIIIGGS